MLLEARTVPGTYPLIFADNGVISAAFASDARGDCIQLDAIRVLIKRLSALNSRQSFFARPAHPLLKSLLILSSSDYAAFASSKGRIDISAIFHRRPQEEVTTVRTEVNVSEIRRKNGHRYFIWERRKPKTHDCGPTTTLTTFSIGGIP